MAAMIRMMATTISSSISEKPEFVGLRFEVSLFFMMNSAIPYCLGTEKRLGREVELPAPSAVNQSYCNGFSATGHSAFVSAAVAPVGSKRITPEASEQKLR